MCQYVFFFQAEDGIRDVAVTGVQTCALPIFRSGLVDRGRRDRSELREEAGGLFERPSELYIFRRVFGREVTDGSGGLGDIVVEKERLPIGRWREDARVGRENLTIEFIELQIAGNVSAEWTECMRQS